MDEAQKTGFEPYWGIPKDTSEWSPKAIAELVSQGYEMSDQGEPMYEAYALGMVAIISELRAMNRALADLLRRQVRALELLEAAHEKTAPAEKPRAG